MTLLDLPSILTREEFLSDESDRLHDVNKLFPNRNWVTSKTFDDNRVRMSVRTKRFKFINRGQEELYDLVKDPFEQQNIIGEMPKLEHEMRTITKTNLRTGNEMLKIKRKTQFLQSEGGL